MDHRALQPYRKSSDLGMEKFEFSEIRIKQAGQNICYVTINSEHFMSSGFNGIFSQIHACSISKHCYEINLLKFQSLD